MAEPKPKTFAAAVAENGLMMGAKIADEAIMLRWSSQREPLTVYRVDTHDTPEFGGVWDIIAAAADGVRYTFNMWSNARRDDNLTLLMQLVETGPVSGVVLANAGKGNKPFYLLEAA
jgi:hypothetical protein